MFAGNDKLSTIDMSSFDLSKANTGHMFYQSRSLDTLKLGEKSNFA
ncbi:hypothetical protein JZO66_14395 [Enterococcus sp. DIV0242_7C1]|uniref:Uncharacterized protein n=1 Tax=Candidatus Enterococcus dunnyi TaxID=1834192 RepID=A0A200JBN0_9ENTE|nr:hypothetical protein [Enterococcus sp. DIV0242_7C1]OUZ34604.1 hypothetical protein A5889_000079 [Enterococcus sp. 9D6_DIV0238]